MSPKIRAIAVVAVTVVAIVGLILDGPRAAYYPAVTALLGGLVIYQETRYPQMPKRRTRRRIIDTTTFLVLFTALFIGGLVVTKPGNSIPWTVPVTLLVFVATLPFTFAGVIRDAFRGQQPLSAQPTSAITTQAPQPEAETIGRRRPGDSARAQL